MPVLPIIAIGVAVLIEIITKWIIENTKKYENSNTYIIDEIYHENKDSDTWCLTEEEKNKLILIEKFWLFENNFTQRKNS